jgi:hypothetical protein
MLQGTCHGRGMAESLGVFIMNISRIWNMPNTNTFDIPGIGNFVQRYLRLSNISADPFARNNQWCTYTNDLNPETRAQSHIDAVDFLEQLKSTHVYPDLIILDPPYSMHQVVKSYSGYGNKRVNSLTPIYNLCTEIVPVNGVVLSFGFNSNGIARPGFEIEEILLVAHGGHHNDTICMSERHTSLEVTTWVCRHCFTNQWITHRKCMVCGTPKGK